MKKHLKMPGLMKASQPRFVGLFGVFGADIKAVWIGGTAGCVECVGVCARCSAADKHTDELRQIRTRCVKTDQCQLHDCLLISAFNLFIILSQALCLFFLSPAFINPQILTKSPMQAAAV